MERRNPTRNLRLAQIPGDIVLVMCTVSVVLYGGLPDVVPLHFDREGLADLVAPRWLASVLLPAIALAVLWIPLELDRWSPRGFELSRGRAAVDGATTCVLLFLAVVHALLLASAMGVGLPLHRLFPAGLGLMIAGVGLFLPGLPRNVWFGVTMPWTLASRESWERSHACSGAIWSMGGVVLALTGVWVPEIMEVWISGLVALLLSSVLVSYLVSS